VATAIIDGIATRYEVTGAGPPLLMYAPGGFDATIEKWSTLGIYARVQPLKHLSEHFSCIAFDRREAGQSGGRIEQVTWQHYVAQGRGLLDHLGVEKAHLIGGCMGCCPVTAFAVTHPQTVLSMILFWPVGGARYRLSARQRFGDHLAFVHENGLEAVIEVAREGKTFGADPRGGPWASVIRNDADFAQRFAKQDVAQYALIVAGMGRTLIDRDTAPGAEPDDLLRLDIRALIVPGSDASHATSAARYLEECIPGAQYWDVPPSAQTEVATASRLFKFLRDIG
jgi:pimeloyl-ACP methyl ester carboxylesterase